MIEMEQKLTELIKTAAGKGDVILGKPLGRNPKFFIIGDSPSMKDTLTRTPFSGELGAILASALETLQIKLGATNEDCYITYLVKTPIDRNKITRASIDEYWLEIAQLEYQLSGCDSVVALGRIAHTYAGHIPVRPACMGKPEPESAPTLMNKLRACWIILNK